MRTNEFVARPEEFKNAGGVSESSIAIDANADGIPDLFRAPSLFDEAPELAIEIYINLGAGRFSEAADSIINPVPTVGYLNGRTLVADFNGDLSDDLFLIDQGLEIGDPSTFPYASPRLLLSDSLGGMIDATTENLPEITEFNHNASAGDVDNDGDLDIVVAALSDLLVYMLLNDGSGRFELVTDAFPAEVRSFAFDPGAAFLADINTDGKLDAIFGSYISTVDKFVSVSIQTETGQFVEDHRVPIRNELTDGGFSQFVGADFDVDGDVDLLARIEGGDVDGLMALRNDGGRLTDVTTEWFGASAYEDFLPDVRVAGLVVVDINNDLVPDISFAHAGLPLDQLSRYLLINNGNGVFSPMPNADFIDPEIDFTSPIFVDFDLDGDIDIAGFNRDVDEIEPGVFVERGYEIVVLENTVR